MRRLRRILRNVATAGSLALCVALSAVWVAGYWCGFQVAWSRGEPTAGQRAAGYDAAFEEGISTDHGGVCFFSSSGGSDAGLRFATNGGGFVRAIDNDSNARWHVGGFRQIHFPNESDFDLLRVPLYAPVVLTALLPAARLVGLVRRRRRAARTPHACPRCGYDCRATPDRCPECGRETAASAPP